MNETLTLAVYSGAILTGSLAGGVLPLLGKRTRSDALLSFSAGLLSQVPGGVGVMEAVFLAVMPGIPATAVVAALLVWRLFYLLLPLAMSIPAIVLFERSQIGKATRALTPTSQGH